MRPQNDTNFSENFIQNFIHAFEDICKKRNIPFQNDNAFKALIRTIFEQMRREST